MESLSMQTILEKVNLILASQPRLVQFHSQNADAIHNQASDQSSVTGTDNGTTQDAVATILPASIPPLPPTALTLPTTTPADPLASLTDTLTNHVLPYLNLSSLSPRYYGLVTGGTTPAALAADILSSVYDQNAAIHLPAESIATTIEAAALNLLVDLFHLPKKTWGIGITGGGSGGGIITTGATASNIVGLALGREYVLSEAVRRKTGQTMSPGTHGLLRVSREADIEQIIVLSTLPHSSLTKAASILGIGRDNVISIASPTNPLQIDESLFQSKLENATQDKTAYILAISAGEVNTARFATRGLSEMQRLRSLCDKHGVWIHVDGAFGLFARALMNDPSLGSEYSTLTNGVEGIELADSITGDGHKLLNVPYDCGLSFTRHKSLAEAVFSNGNAAYLTSTSVQTSQEAGGDGIQSPSNIGLENSRRFRALPVYATLMAYGRDGYVDMLRRQIGLARQIAAWIWDRSGLELLPVEEEEEEEKKKKEDSLAKTFIGVLFRAVDEGLNHSLVRKINDSGRIYVTGTQWDGRSAARIAVSNWRVDVERDSEVVKEVLESVLKEHEESNRP